MAVVHLMKEWSWLLCHDGSPITETGTNEANMGISMGEIHIGPQTVAAVLPQIVTP